DALSERRKRWITLLRSRKYQPLIAEVLEQELPKYANSTVVLPDSLGLASITRECIHILASAPLVFAAAVDGTLAQRFLTDPELQRQYAVFQGRAHVQPSIYIHLLVDEEGVAPTAEQYMLVRDTLLKYVNAGNEHEELAWAIDNITRPMTSRTEMATGHRKYLWTKKRSPKHLATLHRLSAGILHRYNSTPPSLRNTPLTFPPAECGYSFNSHIRLAQHRNRQSSNYVMNLVEDICTYLFKTSQHFSMHQYIIYLVFRPEQAALAEIFCSGLLQVWVDEGGGLNAYPAGRSVASAGRIGLKEWREHEKWVEGNTRLNEELRGQRER
ncbi:hypothetical protein CC80DRAFT_370320, partial [Byssothecium circinans]